MRCSPDGADALLELVGPATIVDSFGALRPGARTCLTGYLEDVWDVAGARAEAARLRIELESFGSNVINVDSYGAIFQAIVEGIESSRYRVNLDRTFPLVEVADAHRYMEANHAAGKVVGLP